MLLTWENVSQPYFQIIYLKKQFSLVSELSITCLESIKEKEMLHNKWTEAFFKKHRDNREQKDEFWL